MRPATHRIPVLARFLIFFLKKSILDSGVFMPIESLFIKLYVLEKL